MKPGGVVINLACAYECLALTTGRVPTWTKLVRSLPTRRRSLVVGVFLAWFVAHMFPREKVTP